MTKLRGAGFLVLLAACGAPSGEEVGASSAAATDGDGRIAVSMADQRARAFEGARGVGGQRRRVSGLPADTRA